MILVSFHHEVKIRGSRKSQETGSMSWIKIDQVYREMSWPNRGFPDKAELVFGLRFAQHSIKISLNLSIEKEPKGIKFKKPYLVATSTSNY